MRNYLSQNRIYTNVTNYRYDRIELQDDWALLKLVYLNNPTYNACTYYVIHKDCFNHFTSKWTKSPFMSANINKLSVSCCYCKVKSSRDVMKRIKFILGI